MTIHTSKFTRNPRTLAEVRRNRIGNPRMGVDTAGWAGIAAGTFSFSLVAASGPPAPNAARITLTATSANWGIRRTGLAVAAGAVYTFSAYVRCTVATNLAVVIRWMDSGGALISESVGTPVAQGATVWGRRSVTATAPLNAVTAQVEGRVVASMPSGSSMDLTSALLENQDTLGTYFDGSTPDAGEYYYRWSGTADASTSTQNILNPLDVAVPALIDGYEAAADERTETHDVVNTESVIVSVQPATSKRGTFTLVFDDMYFAMIAFDLFCQGGLLDFTDDETPEVDMQIVPSGGRIDMSQDDTRGVWLIRLPFVEVV